MVELDLRGENGTWPIEIEGDASRALPKFVHWAKVTAVDSSVMHVCLESLVAKQNITMLCRLLYANHTEQNLDRCCGSCPNGKDQKCSTGVVLTECDTCFRSYCSDCVGDEPKDDTDFECRVCTAGRNPLKRAITTWPPQSVDLTFCGTKHHSSTWSIITDPNNGFEQLCCSDGVGKALQIFAKGDFAYLNERPFQQYMHDPDRLAEILHHKDDELRTIVEIKDWRIGTDDEVMVRLKKRFCRGLRLGQKKWYRGMKRGNALGARAAKIDWLVRWCFIILSMMSLGDLTMSNQQQYFTVVMSSPVSCMHQWRIAKKA
jgi:hypothetical protein